MPTDSADYAVTREAGQSIDAQRARRAALRPRLPSTTGYMVTACAISLTLFLTLWWMLASSDVEAGWIPALLAASAVMLVALAGREVAMRRAWARYTQELEMEMRGETAARGQRPRREHMGARTSATALRALRQRLTELDAPGAQPVAHLEAYRLCAQYLASTEEALRAARMSTDARATVRAGQERVRVWQRRHMLAWARGSAQGLTREAKRQAQVAERVETAQRALEIIEEALQAYPDETELRDSAAAVREFIAAAQIAHWVELAERSIFKGHYEQAIDHYHDALFYLSRAEMNEATRAAAARRITRQVEMLRARLATGQLDEEPPAGPR